VVKFNCPNCSAIINARDDQAGAKGRCKKCRKVVEVPEAAPVPPNLPSDDFDDAGEWGESYSEGGYDDEPEDPNDLYRQLPPTGKKTIAKKQWSPQAIAVGNLLLVLACVVLTISTLVGIVIGVRIAYVKVDAAGLLTTKSGKTSASEEHVKESFLAMTETHSAAWVAFQAKVKTELPVKMLDVSASVQKSENLLVEYTGLMTAKYPVFVVFDFDPTVKHENEETCEFRFVFSNGEWKPERGVCNRKVLRNGRISTREYSGEEMIAIIALYQHGRL